MNAHDDPGDATLPALDAREEGTSTLADPAGSGRRPDAPLERGAVVDRYVILSRLGAGGMALRARSCPGRAGQATYRSTDAEVDDERVEVDAWLQTHDPAAAVEGPEAPAASSP